MFKILPFSQWMELSKEAPLNIEGKREQASVLVNDINTSLTANACLDKLVKLRCLCKEMLREDPNPIASPVNLLYQQVSFLLQCIFNVQEEPEKTNGLNCNYLTRRESEILKFVILGYTAKRIGRELKISFRTVEKYIDSLKLKFRCNSKGELVELAIKSGYINQFNNDEKV